MFSRNMKLSLLILIGAVLATLKCSAKAEYVETRPCRLIDNSLSRCLDMPVKMPDSPSNWCPYRLCATSYGPGLRCPPLGYEKHKASDECSMKEKTVSVYKCIPGGEKRTVKLPTDCVEDCKEMPACECRTEIEKQMVWIQSEKINPSCEERSVGPIENEEYAWAPNSAEMRFEFR